MAQHALENVVCLQIGPSSFELRCDGSGTPVCTSSSSSDSSISAPSFSESEESGSNVLFVECESHSPSLGSGFSSEDVSEASSNVIFVECASSTALNIKFRSCDADMPIVLTSDQAGNAEVILVGGVCYYRAGLTDDPADTPSFDQEFTTCEECESRTSAQDESASGQSSETDSSESCESCSACCVVCVSGAVWSEADVNGYYDYDCGSWVQRNGDAKIIDEAGTWELLHPLSTDSFKRVFAAMGANSGCPTDGTGWAFVAGNGTGSGAGIAVYDGDCPSGESSGESSEPRCLEVCVEGAEYQVDDQFTAGTTLRDIVRNGTYEYSPTAAWSGNPGGNDGWDWAGGLGIIAWNGLEWELRAYDSIVPGCYHAWTNPAANSNCPPESGWVAQGVPVFCTGGSGYQTVVVGGPPTVTREACSSTGSEESTSACPVICVQGADWDQADINGTYAYDAQSWNQVGGSGYLYLSGNSWFLAHPLSTDENDKVYAAAATGDCPSDYSSLWNFIAPNGTGTNNVEVFDGACSETSSETDSSTEVQSGSSTDNSSAQETSSDGSSEIGSDGSSAAQTSSADQSSGEAASSELPSQADSSGLGSSAVVISSAEQQSSAEVIEEGTSSEDPSGRSCTSANACASAGCDGCCGVDFYWSSNAHSSNCNGLTDREIVELFLTPSELDSFCTGNGQYCDYYVNNVLCDYVFDGFSGNDIVIDITICCGCSKA